MSQGKKELVDMLMKFVNGVGPIMVRPNGGRYELIAGERRRLLLRSRRLRAARELHGDKNH